MSNIEFMIGTVEVKVKDIGIKCDAADFPMIAQALRVNASAVVKEGFQDAKKALNETIQSSQQPQVAEIPAAVEQVVTEKIVYVPAPLADTTTCKYEDFAEAKKKPSTPAKELYSLATAKNFPVDEVDYMYTAHLASVLGEIMPNKRYLKREVLRNHFNPDVVSSLSGELLDGRILWMRYPDYDKRKLDLAQFTSWTLFQCLAPEVKAERLRLMKQYTDYVSLFAPRKESDEELERKARVFLEMNSDEQKFEVLAPQISERPDAEEAKFIMESVSTCQELFNQGRLTSVELKETLYKAEILKERRAIQETTAEALRNYGSALELIKDPDMVDVLFDPKASEETKENIVRQAVEKKLSAAVNAEVDTAMQEEREAEEKDRKETLAAIAAEDQKRVDADLKKRLKEAEDERKKTAEFEKRRAEEKKAEEEKKAKEAADLDWGPSSDEEPDFSDDPFLSGGKKRKPKKEEPKVEIKEEDDMSWLDFGSPTQTTTTQEKKSSEISLGVKPKKQEPKADDDIFDNTDRPSSEISLGVKPKKTEAKKEEDEDPFGLAAKEVKKSTTVKQNTKELSFGGDLFDEDKAERKIKESGDASPYDFFDELPMTDVNTVWKSSSFDE